MPTQPGTPPTDARNHARLALCPVARIAIAVLAAWSLLAPNVVESKRRKSLTEPEPRKRGPKPHQDRPTTIKLRVSESTRERWKRWAEEHNTTVSAALRDGMEKMIAPPE